MTAELPLAGMVAARELLGNFGTDLLGWAAARWETWLELQRSVQERRELAGTELVAVAAITCLEDLPLHVGLMQLISIPSLHCTVVLVLPNEETVRLAEARARREGWHALVHIVRRGELDRLLGRLSADELLAVFP